MPPLLGGTLEEAWTRSFLWRVPGWAPWPFPPAAAPTYLLLTRHADRGASVSAAHGRPRRAGRRFLSAALGSLRLDRALRARSLRRRWGHTPAGAYALAALRNPHGAAIVDELGTLSFAEVHQRTDALAVALRERGVDHRDTVAILCRNHSGFIEASVACSKLAANVAYLDPGAGRTALTRIIRREDAGVLICDQEFLTLLADVPCIATRLIAWCDPGTDLGHPTLDGLIANAGPVCLKPPQKGTVRHPTFTLSGPRAGAGSSRRRLPATLGTPGARLSRIPLRRGEPTVIAAPMWERWGFLHLTLGLRLGSTLFLRREFEPVELLETLEDSRATAVAILPDMLQRIMRLPAETVRWYQTDALSVIAVRSGELPCRLAMPAINRFGDVLYSLRGPAIVRLEPRSQEPDLSVAPSPRVASDPSVQVPVVAVPERPGVRGASA